MYLHKLRGMFLFIEKCIEGKYPDYLNELFVDNRGSNNRKFNMLVQPKFNSKYGHNTIRYQGLRVWNSAGVDIELKLAANFNEWFLEYRCSYCDMCVVQTL